MTSASLDINDWNTPGLVWTKSSGATTLTQHQNDSKISTTDQRKTWTEPSEDNSAAPGIIKGGGAGSCRASDGELKDYWRPATTTGRQCQRLNIMDNCMWTKSQICFRIMEEINQTSTRQKPVENLWTTENSYNCTTVASWWGINEGTKTKLSATSVNIAMRRLSSQHRPSWCHVGLIPAAGVTGGHLTTKNILMVFIV